MKKRARFAILGILLMGGCIAASLVFIDWIVPTTLGGVGAICLAEGMGI